MPRYKCAYCGKTIDSPPDVVATDGDRHYHNDTFTRKCYVKYLDEKRSKRSMAPDELGKITSRDVWAEHQRNLSSMMDSREFNTLFKK